MIVLGLTGSIGMGKSTTAELFRQAGAPVYDADAEVAALYAKGGAAVEPVGALFPDAIRDGQVDRSRLSAVLADKAALARLEAVVHPLVGARRKIFLDKARADGAAVAVLDIPLLFEVGADKEVDAIVVVTASGEIQRERALARPGMTAQKLELMLARQTPDAEKRTRATFLIDTSGGLDRARRDVQRILETLDAAGWIGSPRRPLICGGEPGHSYLMAREIVLDTETTGLDHRRGDRLVEIACIELLDLLPTGRSFHRYINPERDMPIEAEKVHGLSAKFLADKPKFAETHVCDAFLEFVGDAVIIAHNAAFDRGFINHELGLLGRDALHETRWLDTLGMAQKRFPGMYNSLDALCKRFKISLADREKHGALIDARLLAEVYLELQGGRERGLELTPQAAAPSTVAFASQTQYGARPRPLEPRSTDAEREAHAAFIQAYLKDKAVWLKFGVG